MIQSSLKIRLVLATALIAVTGMAAPASATPIKNIIQVFLKRDVVASRPGCNEEFTRKGTLWNTYPLEILD